MTRQETLAIMSILKASYPAYYRGMGRTEAEGIVNLWAEMFADDDSRHVAAAVKALIATDAKGFPPHIGAVKEKLRQITTPKGLDEAEAWGLVSEALHNSLYGAKQEFDRLPPEVQSVVHAPEQLKAWAMMPEDTVQSVVASNFRRSYRARSQAAQEWAALPGDVRQMAKQLTAAMPSLPEV